MSIRREPTYLSTDVWRACWMLSKAQPDLPGKPSVTPDSIADGLLRDVISEQYPQLFEHQKQVAKMETELLKTL